MLYHHTTPFHLPWIIKSGELRPGTSNPRGAMPPDFLWATTNPFGDRTAMSHAQRDLTRVRFAVREDDFFPWKEAPSRHPEWTPFVAGLELRACKMGQTDFAGWYCRNEALPLTGIESLQIKTMSSKEWQTIDLPEVRWVPRGGQQWLSVELAGRVFLSVRKPNSHGSYAYTGDVARPSDVRAA